MFPLNMCFKPYILSNTYKAKYFTYRCKKMVLQCFVLKPVLSVITLFIIPLADISWLSNITSFISIVVAISVTFSLYYLILFY